MTFLFLKNLFSLQPNLVGEVKSINGVNIRLTFERWYHISENHRELVGTAFEVLDTINRPDIVVKGLAGEFLALRKINKKYLVNVYREINKTPLLINSLLN